MHMLQINCTSVVGGGVSYRNGGDRARCCIYLFGNSIQSESYVVAVDGNDRCLLR